MKNEQAKGFPKEIQESALRERIAKAYPLLYMDKFLLVDTQTTRLAIDDITYKAKEPINEDIETLMLSCIGWIEVYDAEGLTFALNQRLKRLLSTVNGDRCIILFPGNGAKTVKDLLPKEITEGVTIIQLPTQRKVDARGIVDGVTVLDATRARKIIADTKAETVIVLDDVIVTGTTLSAIRTAIPGRNIQWYAGSLFMKSPIQRGKGTSSQSGINGYVSIITPLVYQGTTGTPALNSLSTLIENSAKADAVRSRYIEKYVEDKEEFLQAIQQLQQKVIL